MAPAPNEPLVFRVSHRFSDEASPRAWEDSGERRELTAETDAFSTLQQQATGMETWFAVSPAQQAAAPKKRKMALTTFFAAAFEH